MQLTDLLAEPHRFLTGLTADSRAVKKGYLFAALPGTKADGGTYIADALARGASVVLAAPDTDVPDGGTGDGTVVRDPNPRQALARLAAAFFAPLPASLVAVTGTNGKTSTATFALQLWQGMGLKAATIGTNGLHGSGLSREGALTTPDPVSLAADLSFLHQKGITHVALEASSHGLDQFRLDGLTLAAAGFTYLGRDHLDYHQTTERYFHAKSQLFERLLPSGAVAVLNADVPECVQLTALCAARHHRVLTYGQKGGRAPGRAGLDLHLDAVEPEPGGLRLSLVVLGQAHTVRVPLTGAFQADNILCALGLVIGAGSGSESDVSAACAALSTLKGVRGRMEHVATTPAGAGVYVDYAHTPDALEAVLSALRPHTRGRLHVVFGCGGNRDKGKRPQMGAVAARLADRIYVTDDNPRHEDPRLIRREVLEGCRGAGGAGGGAGARAGSPQAFDSGERGAAIQQALDALEGGDTLVIAGKGHEQGQIVGDDVLPFDDAEVVRRRLSRDPCPAVPSDCYTVRPPGPFSGTTRS